MLVVTPASWIVYHHQSLFSASLHLLGPGLDQDTWTIQVNSALLPTTLTEHWPRIMCGATRMWGSLKSIWTMATNSSTRWAWSLDSQPWAIIMLTILLTLLLGDSVTSGWIAGPVWFLKAHFIWRLMNCKRGPDFLIEILWVRFIRSILSIGLVQTLLETQWVFHKRIITIFFLIT